MVDPTSAVRLTQIQRPFTRSGPELRPRFRWLSLVEVERRGTWEEHRHVHYEVIVVRRGRYRCRVDGVELTLGAGEALVVRPGAVHEDFIAPPLIYAAINMTLPGGGRMVGRGRAGRELDAPPGQASVDLFRRTAPASAGRLAAAAEDWWAVVERVSAECRRPAPDAPLLDALCVDLLRRVLRAVPAEHLDPAWVRGGDDEFIARLQAAFTEHQGRTVPVAVLARACGVGVRTFTARCHAATGLPPAKALLRHRCEQAVRLLHEGLSVAATAERLGFASQFHFSRAFKRHLGEAPSRLR